MDATLYRLRNPRRKIWFLPRWWLVFCGIVNVAAGYGIWILFGYLLLTH